MANNNKISKKKAELILEYDKAYKNSYNRARRRGLKTVKIKRGQLAEMSTQQLNNELRRLNKSHRRRRRKEKKIQKAKRWNKKEWVKMTRKDQQFLSNFFQGAQAILNSGNMSLEEKMLFADMMSFLDKMSWSDKKKFFDDMLKIADQSFKTTIFSSERFADVLAGETGTGWLGEPIQKIFKKYGFVKKESSEYEKYDETFIDETIDKLYKYRKDYVSKKTIMHKAQEAGVNTQEAAEMQEFTKQFYSSEVGGRWARKEV